MLQRIESQGYKLMWSQKTSRTIDQFLHLQTSLMPDWNSWTWRSRCLAISMGWISKAELASSSRTATEWETRRQIFRILQISTETGESDCSEDLNLKILIIFNQKSNSKTLSAKGSLMKIFNFNFFRENYSVSSPPISNRQYTAESPLKVKLMSWTYNLQVISQLA